MAYYIFNKLIPYVFIIVVASFLGFIVENVWVGIRYGYFDNRGMVVPGLLGYGLAIIGVFLILGTPDHPRFLWTDLFLGNTAAQFAYFVFVSAVLVSVGEIALGTFVEKYCQIEQSFFIDYEVGDVHKYRDCKNSGNVSVYFFSCRFSI